MFAATSLKSGEDWRWQTHLMNVPIYYEFKQNKVDLTTDATKEITFSFGDNFKSIFDLYLTDSTVEAASQSIEEGTLVSPGTVVEVRFASNVIDYAPQENL